MKKMFSCFLIAFMGCIYSCHQPAETSDGSMTGTVNPRLNEPFGQEQKEVISMLDSFNIPELMQPNGGIKKRLWCGQSPISIKKLPGILQPLSGISTLIKQALLPGLMNC